MEFAKSKPVHRTWQDAVANDWQTLTLDAAGHITGGDQDMLHLLGPQSEALTGKAIKSVFADLPFSDNTPGYNLAYAVFHGASGVKVRRTARSATGRCVPLDTVLSSHSVEGQRNITLSYRPAA